MTFKGALNEHNRYHSFALHVQQNKPATCTSLFGGQCQELCPFAINCFISTQCSGGSEKEEVHTHHGVMSLPHLDVYTLLVLYRATFVILFPKV